MENEVEVYRQRYETWRHLDKQRWQLVQFLIAIGSGTALILRVTPDAANGLFWILIGSAILYIALAMNRISEAIRGNGAVLKSAGEAIGDTEIPDVSDMNKSVGHWLTITVGAVGIVLLTWGIISF